MFKNIGKKIKGLAALVCWLGIISSAFTAVALWMMNYIAFAIIVFIVGCLASWIGSFYAYAFGEITENSAKQAEMIAKLSEQLAQMKNSSNN